MKKGKVIVGALSHKNKNYVFKEFEPVTENDVENWDLLVEKGYIKPDEAKKEPVKTEPTKVKKEPVKTKK